MSSLTATTTLPQLEMRFEAPESPRHTSVRGVPAANWRKITGRRLVSRSCITTARMPLIESVLRRWLRNSGS